jgi:hypothetical protein
MPLRENDKPLFTLEEICVNMFQQMFFSIQIKLEFLCKSFSEVQMYL